MKRRNVQGLGTLYTWNVVSPRLGVTTKLTADSRTILRASYGRFHQGISDGRAGTESPGLTPITTTAFDPVTGDYTTLVSIIDPESTCSRSQNARAKTDEYSIGVDRELGGRLSGPSLISARPAATISDGPMSAASIERKRETARRPNPPGVRARQLHGRSSFPGDEPGRLLVTYNGLVIAAEKRPSRGWQAFGSYTYSKARDCRCPAEQPPQARSSAPSRSSPHHVRSGSKRPHECTGPDAERSPAHLPGHGQGRRATNRPRQSRPICNISAASHGLRPRTVPLPQGDQRILLEPRGSRRLSSQALLDLRLSRPIRAATDANRAPRGRAQCTQ